MPLHFTFGPAPVAPPVASRAFEPSPTPPTPEPPEVLASAAEAYAYEAEAAHAVTLHKESTPDMTLVPKDGFPMKFTTAGTKWASAANIVQRHAVGLEFEAELLLMPCRVG